MPVHVEKMRGARPWKIVETASGKVVGSSLTAKMAHISASHRNAAHAAKLSGMREALKRRGM